mmetsp:Transcript_16930/g.41348  ORF Transcript_16930/g.41348 Transcript_16930/m.41348 type:complete len:268 (-) Transcript_16930:1676-2479(-)
MRSRVAILDSCRRSSHCCRHDTTAAFLMRCTRSRSRICCVVYSAHPIMQRCAGRISYLYLNRATTALWCFSVWQCSSRERNACTTLTLSHIRSASPTSSRLCALSSKQEMSSQRFSRIAATCRRARMVRVHFLKCRSHAWKVFQSRHAAKRLWFFHRRIACTCLCATSCQSASTRRVKSPVSPAIRLPHLRLSSACISSSGSHQLPWHMTSIHPSRAMRRGRFLRPRTNRLPFISISHSSFHVLKHICTYSPEMSAMNLPHLCATCS